LRHRFFDLRSQARVVREMVDDLLSLLLDGEAPTPATQVWLEAPFEEREQQDCQTGDEFALFRLAHAFDLQRDVLDIRFCQPTITQKGRLLVGPGVKVFIVVLANRAHRTPLGTPPDHF
jgi:hypothetical protein